MREFISHWNVGSPTTTVGRGPGNSGKLAAQYFFNSPMQAKSRACSFGTCGVLIAKHCRSYWRRLQLKGKKEEMKGREGKTK